MRKIGADKLPTGHLQAWIATRTKTNSRTIKYKKTVKYLKKIRWACDMQSELDHMKIEDVSAKILSVLLSLVKETNISHSQHAILIIISISGPRQKPLHSIRAEQVSTVFNSRY